MCLTSTVLGSVLGGGGCVVSVRERVCVCVAKIVARKFEVIGAIGGKKGKIKLIFGLPLFWLYLTTLTLSEKNLQDVLKKNFSVRIEFHLGSSLKANLNKPLI